MQIHLLEEVDRTTPTSPLRSPSRELSLTLRNLKRLESALQGRKLSSSLINFFEISNISVLRVNNF